MGVRSVVVGGCLTASALLAACGNSTAPQVADSLMSLPRTLSATEHAGVQGGNAFALSLLQRVGATQSGNVLLSPFSVWTALGMTLNGAANETEREMRAVLGWDGQARADINAAYRDLATMLPTLDPRVVVKSANGIWVRTGITPDTTFSREMQQYFGATVTPLATPQAMFAAVNAWGNQQTNGLVPQVLQSPPPADLLMLLANAVVFDGQWREGFDTKDTRPATFRLGDGIGAATVTVPTMHRSGGYRAIQAATYQAVELAYGNSAYSMLILVPTTGTLSALVAQLDTAMLSRVVVGLTPVPSNAPLALPRFRLTGSVELSNVLAQMGMPRAFSSAAQFPRLTGLASKIGFVQHGVSVEVDERGTRAAAVTVVGVVLVSLPMGYTVDRPFVFVIRERFAGTILFTGIVRDPS